MMNSNLANAEPIQQQRLPEWSEQPLQKLIKGMAWIASAMLAVGTLHGLVYDAPSTAIICIMALAPTAILARQECPLPGSQRSLLLSITLIAAIGAMLIIGQDGSQSPAITALPAVLLIAATSSRLRGYTILATLTILLVALVSSLEILGLKASTQTPEEIRRKLLIVLPLLTGCAIVVRLVAGTLVRTLHRMHVDMLTNSQTGLPNRRALSTMADGLLAADKRSMGSVIAISIERLDSLENIFGHAFGDAVMRHAAGIIAAHASADCFAGHWSGNVFLLLLRHRASSDHPALCARKIQTTLRSAHLIEGVEVHLDARCGIASDYEGRLAADKQIEYALIALGEAGLGGADGLAEYVEGFSQRIAAEYRYETALRYAIENDRVHMAYQPIFSPDGKQLVAVEALLRLTDMNGLPIPTGEAIRLAEASGLIHRLGLTILRETLQDINIWQDYGAPQLPVLINFSAFQLVEPDMATTIAGILAEHHLATDAIVVEITETAAVSQDGALAETLQALSGLGIPLAIDDFGAGYSSLTRLLDHPAALIKFDNALIHSAERSPAALEFLRRAVHLAHSTRAKVLVEGIENKAQATIASALGCFAVQGYWYEKPIPSEEVPAYLASRTVMPLALA
ncbi:MAG: GGDEF domain-containing protein [Zoogloeaceae bacterium]|nr:GGDEF domain-containing protein [Zoogloeaceae bacterium]